MASIWYQCINCLKVVKSEAASPPSQGGCTKASSHYYSQIGVFGDTDYTCRNCGITIRAKDCPTANGKCNVYSGHNWKKS